MKSFFKKHSTLLTFCTFNSILLVAITFVWINHSYFLSDDEELLIKHSSIAKNIVLAKNQPDPARFLFVNLSWEKQLVEVKNGEGQTIGKRAITDRQRIAKFLALLNRNPEHKFLIVDVWFKDSSDYSSDSMLQAQFNKTKNFLIPYHKNPENDYVKDTAIFTAPTALSDYEKDDFENNFVKFRLVQGNDFKTTPLVLYEKLHKKKFSNDGFWYYMGEKLALNSFILDMRISSYDIQNRQLENEKQGSNYTKIQLSDLLDVKLPLDSIPAEIATSMNNEFRSNMIHDMTKDRIVVLGDFEDSDIHETIYGATPGPLILLNIFLALEEGDNIINIYFVLFLFLGYFLVSFKCYTRVDILDRFVIGNLLPRTNLRVLIMSFMSYLIYFILLSLISYFLFNIHLTILLLALYMELVSTILGQLKKRKSKEKGNNVTASPALS